MKLRQLKNSLMQTEYGRLFRTNMLCSEPIPVKTAEGIEERCFWCGYNWAKNTFTAPLVRLSYDAEKGVGLSFVSCKEEPFFSVGPDTLIQGTNNPDETDEKYLKFEEMYDLVSSLFYKENCSEEEKHLLYDFYRSFKDYVDGSLIVFYRELAPSFFEWIERELKNYQEWK